MERAAPAAQPRLVVACGLPGSGKSTVASFLEARGWVRASEEVGNNTAADVNDALRGGERVVVDQCNFTAPRRERWSSLGAECGLAPDEMAVVWIDSAVDTCARRVSLRDPRRAGGSHLHWETPRSVLSKTIKKFGRTGLLLDV